MRCAKRVLPVSSHLTPADYKFHLDLIHEELTTANNSLAYQSLVAHAFSSAAVQEFNISITELKYTNVGFAPWSQCAEFYPIIKYPGRIDCYPFNGFVQIHA